MATQNLIQPYFLGSVDNTCPLFKGGPEEPEFIEVASSTWAIGDLLYLDSNGKLAICTVTSAKLNSAIAGQAISAATGVTSAQHFFRVIKPTDRFVMNVYHATAASALTNQNQLQDVFGIIQNSSKWHVDINNTTTEDGTTALAKVEVVGFPRRHPDGTTNTIGDTYGLVIVKFLPFTIETDGGNIVRNLQLA